MDSQLFQQQIDEGLHPGAGLAVYRYGNLVLDVNGGNANKQPKTADLVIEPLAVKRSTGSWGPSIPGQLWEFETRP